MLEPINALAFEMQAAKGAFALLLGSGVSRSAKIPTGWDITMDLVRQVAALEGADPGDQPEQWYEERFGRAPDYSDLLDRLASTPTLRQQVIRPYIEPNDEQRARGEKLPTPAHRAIARLMASGHVRVVLTTNFDQLLEQALADLGVKAAVISSADQIAGALPLVHAGPTIVKLHGDYLDTRIRNTSGELSAYEPTLDGLLDQVFDEFGLVVCGWSADWDVALKDAMDRAPSRRFPLYWASRGAPGQAAQGLIERRKGRVVAIEGADPFFEALAERVKAIQDLQQPHPLSTDIAVAMLKEYLPEPRHEIRMSDLLNAEVARLLARLDERALNHHYWSSDIFNLHVATYQAATEPMMNLAYTAGLWSSSDQGQWWVDTVAELAARRRDVAGIRALTDLRSFPATLVLYSFGLGAIVGRRLALLGRVVRHTMELGNATVAMGDALNAYAVVTDGGGSRFQSMPGQARNSLAASTLIADLLRPIARRELRNQGLFDLAFAALELSMSLGFAERRRARSSSGDTWFPPGLFLHGGSHWQKQIEQWREQHSVAPHNCDVVVMAGLQEAPLFDQAASHFSKTALW